MEDHSAQDYLSGDSTYSSVGRSPPLDSTPFVDHEVGDSTLNTKDSVDQDHIITFSGYDEALGAGRTGSDQYFSSEAGMQRTLSTKTVSSSHYHSSLSTSHLYVGSEVHNVGGPRVASGYLYGSLASKSSDNTILTSGRQLSDASLFSSMVTCSKEQHSQIVPLSTQVSADFFSKRFCLRSWRSRTTRIHGSPIGDCGPCLASLG